MSPTRLFFLTATCAALAAPLSSPAAPAAASIASACAPASMALVQRRISEEAARSLPALIGFVNRTQPIYQIRLVDAVAWLDAERERRNECVALSASATTD